MKKSTPKKLTLSRETLHRLELAQGGVLTGFTQPSVCFSTKEDCCRAN